MQKTLYLVSPSTKTVGGISTFTKTIQKEFKNTATTKIPKIIETNSNGPKLLNLLHFIKSSFILLSAAVKPNSVFYFPCGSSTSLYRKILLSLIPLSLNKASVLHIHGGAFAKKSALRNPFTIWVISYFLKKFNYIYCINNEHKKILNITYRVSLKKIRYITNFTEHHNKGYITNKKKNILFLGSISKSKGVDILIEAFDRINENHSYELHLYGPLVDHQIITEKTKKYYKGILEQNKWQIIEDADIFVLPSLLENFPISLIEALSRSCLVLYSGAGYVNEILSPEIHYVPIELDAKSLSQTISNVIRNKHNYVSIRKAGYQKALELNPEKFVYQLSKDLKIC